MTLSVEPLTQPATETVAQLTGIVQPILLKMRKTSAEPQGADDAGDLKAKGSSSSRRTLIFPLIVWLVLTLAIVWLSSQADVNVDTNGALPKSSTWFDRLSKQYNDLVSPPSLELPSTITQDVPTLGASEQHIEQKFLCEQTSWAAWSWCENGIKSRSRFVYVANLNRDNNGMYTCAERKEVRKCLEYFLPFEYLIEALDFILSKVLLCIPFVVMFSLIVAVMLCLNKCGFDI